MSNNGVPCHYCRGTGREPTALELWDGLSSTLRALTWEDERIETLKADLRTDEVLAGMPRWGGVELQSPDGTIRTFDRFPKRGHARPALTNEHPT